MRKGYPFSSDMSSQNPTKTKRNSAALKMIIAERIRTRREQLQMKQSTLAGLIGTSQAQMSRYEKGENSPTAEVIIQLARALETNPDWLLGFREVSEQGLNANEVEVLELFRSKPPDRHADVLEIMRRV